MPDPTFRILFSSVFPKKAWAILYKTDPDPIRMAWPGLAKLDQVRKQTGVQESSGLVSGRTQPACYQFPSFRFGCVLPQTSRIILNKTSPNPNRSGWLCQVLAKRIRSGSRPMCKKHPARFWPMLPSRSDPDANRIRLVYRDRLNCLHNIQKIYRPKLFVRKFLDSLGYWFCASQYHFPYSKDCLVYQYTLILPLAVPDLAFKPPNAARKLTVLFNNVKDTVFN